MLKRLFESLGKKSISSYSVQDVRRRRRTARDTHAAPPTREQLSRMAGECNAIDVSEWQGRINWERVARHGVCYAYIRACVGNSFVDSQFRRNYREAERHGVRTGFYHYVTARSVSQARRQARFFARTIAPYRYSLRPVLDFESFGRLNRDEINRIALVYLRELERYTRHRPAIYSDSNNAVNTFTDRRLTRYPLWVAAYGVRRPETGNWRAYSMWQYADDGRIPGIRDDSVDLDHYRRGLVIRRR